MPLPRPRSNLTDDASYAEWRAYFDSIPRLVKYDDRAIRYWYVEQAMSINDIVTEIMKRRQCSITDTTIQNHLRRMGIPLRPPGAQELQKQIRAQNRDEESGKLRRQRRLLLGALNRILDKKRNEALKGALKKDGKSPYIIVKAPANHPRARNGRIAEHILIWERHHKQPLPEGYVIHHFNGNKRDNRPENLKAMARDKHHPSLWPKYLQQRIRDLEWVNRKLRATIVELTPKLF